MMFSPLGANMLFTNGSPMPTSAYATTSTNNMMMVNSASPLDTSPLTGSSITNHLMSPVVGTDHSTALHALQTSYNAANSMNSPSLASPIGTTHSILMAAAQAAGSPFSQTTWASSDAAFSSMQQQHQQQQVFQWGLEQAAQQQQQQQQQAVAAAAATAGGSGGLQLQGTTQMGQWTGDAAAYGYPHLGTQSGVGGHVSPSTSISGSNAVPMSGTPNITTGNTVWHSVFFSPQVHTTATTAASPAAAQ
ncbi:hypothetical protein HK102_004876, partial [Quaeritorhiza haematococci]